MPGMETKTWRYPLGWRLLDLMDAVVAKVWRRFARFTPLLMLLPAIVLVGLLAGGFVWVIAQSLHKTDPLTLLPQPGLTLDNYRIILERTRYQELLSRSLVSGVLVSLLVTVLAFPYAYCLVRTRHAFLRKALLLFTLLPFLLGAVMRSYAWLVVLGREGVVNTVIGWFGFGPLSLVYTYQGVIIGLVQLYLPFAILMLAPAITAIGEEMEEVAYSLGASASRVVWSVLIPMAAPGLVGATIVTFTLVFADMTIPAILGGGRVDFIANALYNEYIYEGDHGIGAALGVVTTVIATALVAVFFMLRRLVSFLEGRAG